MAKPKIKAQIKNSTAALKQIMQEGLEEIAQNMVSQILTSWRNLPNSKRLEAIKDVKPQGIAAYKDKLLNAFAVIAADSINQARREVPKKRNVRLAFNDEGLQFGEFENLPPVIRARIKAQLDLLSTTQVADLEKALYFQYGSEVLDPEIAEAALSSELISAAEDYIGGNSIQGGASATAAQIVNEARLAFFSDNEVADEIDAYEFVNEDPVSPICQDLAGTVFAKDDPNLHKYWPPLHFNCKSWISTILKGDLGNKEIDDLTPSKSSLNDFVQFSEQVMGDVIMFKHIENPPAGNLQTIIISKDIAKTKQEAEAIAKDFGASELSVDETDSSFRFRQRDPKDFIEGSFKTFQTPKNGVSLVYGKLKT